MEREQRQALIDNIKTLHTQGKTITEACKELGVNIQTYYGWMRGPKKKGSKLATKVEPSHATKKNPIVSMRMDEVFFEVKDGLINIYKL